MLARFTRTIYRLIVLGIPGLIISLYRYTTRFADPEEISYFRFCITLLLSLWILVTADYVVETYLDIDEYKYSK